MIMKSAPSVKYEIIRQATENDNNLLNLTWLCQMAGVSRSGYYYWLESETNRAKKETDDERDFALIVEAYQFRGYDKGVRGLHMRLLHLNPPVVINPKKIRRLMHKYGLVCPIRKANPYRRMAKALQTNRIAQNILNREFKAHKERSVLLTDITYIRREVDKFTYVVVIMDAFTKEILSYVVSPSLDVDFVLSAVEQLAEKHGHELKTNCLIHSDQGCHYTSHKFVDLIANKNLRQSMSRKANCWDNAPQESFWGHMKDHLRLNPSDNNSRITHKVNDWMDYYNNDRGQWKLAKLTPAEYYQYVTTGVYPLAIKPPTTDQIKSNKGDDEYDN